jgi:large subunit ribosomal protein L18
VSEGCTIESALKVGAQVATELKKRHLSTAVFDRAGYKYTGVVSAVANSIRENGISI